MRSLSGRRTLRFFAFGGLLMPFVFLAPGTPSAPHAGATGRDGAVRCTMAMSYGPYLMNSLVRVGDYEGELCFGLTPVPADPARRVQELPADYDDYSPPPWEEAPPAATGFRLQAEAACPSGDRLTAPRPPELQPGERLRAVSFWLRTDTELEARPGEVRAWQAALRPRDFQFALESTGAPAPDGVDPRWGVQYQPSAQALDRPLSDEELRLVTEFVTTARVALLEDGRVTIEESRGPEPITFAVTAERILPE